MKIISGAQTGADRGGLDAAVELGIPYGGWVPKGHRAEDGRIPHRYKGLTETASTGYPTRTELNVINSDATVIFALGGGGPGSRLTADLARKHEKPVLHINLKVTTDIAHAAQALRGFVTRYKVETLNVAGSRESNCPGIQERVRATIVEAMKLLTGDMPTPPPTKE